MKTLKKVTFTCLIVFGLIALNSCSKDDSVFDDNINSNIVDPGDDENDNGGNNPNGDPGDITLYKVQGETIVKVTDYNVSGQDLTYQQDSDKHQEIWSLIKKVVPPNYRTKMSEFLIYNGETSGSAGFVVQTQQDLSKWKMGIAINYANDQQELTYTVIHEFGHILTLNNDQVDASVTENACQNYFVGEGCAKSDAYINKLQTQFWADIWNEYQTAQNNQSGMEQFYNRHQARFVTQYAATNPGEDIAEVFAVFVTRNGGANGNSIAEQKIQLMHNHSELVELRNYIRGNLSARSRGVASLLPEPGSWKQANTFGDPKKSHCSHR
jgi:hypothetical protein